MTTPPISPSLAPVIHVPSGEKAPDSREAPLSMRLNETQTKRLDTLLNQPVLHFKDGSFITFHAVIQRLQEMLGLQLFLIGSANATIIADQKYYDLDLFAEICVDSMDHLRRVVAPWVDEMIHQAVLSLLPYDERFGLPQDFHFQLRCEYFKGRRLVDDDPPIDPSARGAKFGNRFSYFNIGGIVEIKIAYNLLCPCFVAGLEYPFAFTKDGLRLPLDHIRERSALGDVEMISVAGPINRVVECLEKRILLCDYPNGTEFFKWLDLVTLRGYQDSMLGESIFEKFKGIIRTPEERAWEIKKKFEKRDVVLPLLLNLAHFDPTLREQICPSKKAILELYLKHPGLYLIDYTPSQLLREAIAEGSIARLEDLDRFAPLVGEGALREARYQLITSTKNDDEAWSMFCAIKERKEKMLFQLCERSPFIRQKVLEQYKASKEHLDILLQTEHDPEQLVPILMRAAHFSEPVHRAFLVVLEKLPYSEQIVKKASVHKELYLPILRQILKVPSGEIQKFLDLLKEAKVVFDLDKAAFSEEKLQDLLQKMSDEEAFALFNFAKGKKEPLLLLLCKRSSSIRQKVAESCGDATSHLDILLQTEPNPEQLALMLLCASNFSEPVRTAFLVVLEKLPYSEQIVKKASARKELYPLILRRILKMSSGEIQKFLDLLKKAKVAFDLDKADFSEEELQDLLQKMSDEEAFALFNFAKGKKEPLLLLLCKRSSSIRQKVAESCGDATSHLDILLQTEPDPEQLALMLLCASNFSEPVRTAFLVVLEKLPYSEQIVKKASARKELYLPILRQILKVPSGEIRKFLDLLKEAKVVFDLDKAAFSEEKLQDLLQKMSDEEAFALFNFAKGKKEPLLLLLCKRSSSIRQKVAESCGDTKSQLDILFQTEKDPKRLALLLLRAHHYSEPFRTALLIVLENKEMPYSEELVEKALNHKAFVKDHRQILVKQILKVPNDQICKFLEKLKNKEIPLDLDIASLSDEECLALLKKVPYCHEAQFDTLGLHILKRLGITDPSEYIYLLPRGFFGLSDTHFLPFYFKDPKSPEDVVIQLLNTFRVEALQISLFRFALKEKLLPDPDRVLAKIIIFIQTPEIRRDFWKLAQNPEKMVDVFLKGETEIENITLFLSAKSIPNTQAEADAYARLLNIQKSGACLCKALKNHFFRKTYGPLILERLKAMTEEELLKYFPKMASDLKNMPKGDVRQEMLLHLLQSKLPVDTKWHLLNQEDFKNAAIVHPLITLLLTQLETAKTEGEIDAVLPFAGELLKNTTPALANSFHEGFFNRYTHLPATTPALYQLALDLLRQMKDAPPYLKYLKNFTYTCLRLSRNGQINRALGLTLEALKVHKKEDVAPILRLFYDAFPENGMEAEGLWTFAFAVQLDQELFGPLTEEAKERLAWLVKKLPHSFVYMGWDSKKRDELQKTLREHYLSKEYFVDECIKQGRIFPLLQVAFLHDRARSTRLCCRMLIELDPTNPSQESADLLQGILDQLNQEELSDLSAIDPNLQLLIKFHVYDPLKSGAKKLHAYPFLLRAFHHFFLLTMPERAKLFVERNLEDDLEDLRRASKDYARELNSEKIYHEMLKLSAVAYFRKIAPEEELFYYCCSPLHTAFLVEYAYELFAEYPAMGSLDFACFKPILFRLKEVLDNPQALEGYYKGHTLVFQCFNLYELAQASDKEALTIFGEYIAILEKQKTDAAILPYLRLRLENMKQGPAGPPPCGSIDFKKECDQFCICFTRCLETMDAQELVLSLQKSAETLEKITEHVKDFLPDAMRNALLGWAYKINTHLPKNGRFPKTLDTLQTFAAFHLNGLIGIFQFISGWPFNIKMENFTSYFNNILVPALFVRRIDLSAS